MGFVAELARADDLVRARTGEALAYTSGAGVVLQVVGVFDLQHRVVDLGQAGVDGYAPAAFVGVAGLPSDPVTDERATVTARGVRYAIHEVRKTGDQALLLLHRAEP